MSHEQRKASQTTPPQWFRSNLIIAFQHCVREHRFSLFSRPKLRPLATVRLQFRLSTRNITVYNLSSPLTGGFSNLGQGKRGTLECCPERKIGKGGCNGGIGSCLRLVRGEKANVERNDSDPVATLSVFDYAGKEKLFNVKGGSRSDTNRLSRVAFLSPR